jgi:hypothetical protein
VGRIRLPLESLPDLVVVGGPGATDPETGEQIDVSAVEVQLPNALLRGLVLVDTPGVGGLDAAQSRLTANALADADALLLVTRANAVLTTSEVQFATAAADGACAVLVVVTHADVADADVAIADVRRRLAASSPVLASAEVLAYNGSVARLAAELTESDPTTAAAAAARSGVSRIADTLRVMVDGSAGQRATRAALSTLASRAAATATAIDDRLAAMAAPTEEESQRIAQTRRDVLARQSGQDTRRRVQLAADSALRDYQQAPMAFADGAKRLRDDYRMRARTSQASELASLPDLLRGDLQTLATKVLAEQAALAENIVATVAAAMADAGADVDDGLLAEQLRTETESAVAALPERLKSLEPPAFEAPVIWVRDSTVAQSQRIQTSTSLQMLATTAVSGAIMAVINPIASIGAGVGLLLGTGRYRMMTKLQAEISEQSRRQTLESALDAAVNDARDDFSRVCGQTGATFASALRVGLDAVFSEREDAAKAANADLARLKNDLRRDAQERASFAASATTLREIAASASDLFHALAPRARRVG